MAAITHALLPVNLFPLSMGRRRDDMLLSFFKDESGATAIEYGLIGTLISVAIIVGATQLGTTIGGKFTFIGTSVDTAIN